MTRNGWREFASRSALRIAGFVPAVARARILRIEKGLRERRGVKRADVIILSFAKSGRTWFRVMLSRIYALSHGLDHDELLDGGNLNARCAKVPNIFFTHGNYLEEMAASRNQKALFANKKIVFLVRHPADTAVSLYFHNLGGRVNPIKRRAKRMPEDMTGISIADFVFSPLWGVPAVIDYLNFWQEFFADHRSVLVVRYEDMRHEPEAEFSRIAAFLGETFSPDILKEAIASASLERLREQERSGAFRNPAMQARDLADPNSFKVRRGKMGGYRDDLTSADVEKIDQMIAAKLNPAFGYDRPL